MRLVAPLSLVLCLLTGVPVGAQPSLEARGTRAPAAAIGPVKIILLDVCLHAEFEQAVARTRTAVPVEINTSAMDPAACALDVYRAKSALTALAKKLEAERAAATRRHAPVPVTLLYTGTTLHGEGAGATWIQVVKRLSQSALVISPSGNDPALTPSEVWPSSQFSFKVGNAPGGSLSGTVGKEVAIYLDFGLSVEVVVNGRRLTGGASSTSAMLTAAHLANVLARGTGQRLSPSQLLAKLKASFREALIQEEDLEGRLGAVLR